MRKNRTAKQAGTRFRDRARARATTEPPDAEYHQGERAGWRLWVAGIAAALDRLDARGRGSERIAWVLRDAFHTFLPLIDPGWWRAYPPSRPNAARRRDLRRVHKTRRQVFRRRLEGSPTGDMVLRICDAAEVYLWAGDAVGVGRCRRLMKAIKGCPESASAGLRTVAPGRMWGSPHPPRQWGEPLPTGPAFHHGDRGKTSRRHDAGAGAPVPGKEDDV